MTPLIADIIGMIGTICIVVVYLLMQLNKMDARSFNFNLINLFGAVLLFISLCVNFNLASMVIEVFWIIASLIGLYNAYKKAQKKGIHRKSKSLFQQIKLAYFLRRATPAKPIKPEPINHAAAGTGTAGAVVKLSDNWPTALKPPMSK